jgi:adenosylhomocysteine nucleosidase
MGGKRAGAGLEILLGGFDPEAVISFGFGGALDPTLAVGDLVWGKEVLLWEEGRGVSSRLALAGLPAAFLAEHGSPIRSREGFLVSVEGFVPKARVRGALDARFSPALVEMETYALATALRKKGIPLMGLRAVSDEWDFDPAPLVRRWVDADIRVRPWRVVSNVVRHPTCLTVLFGLFQRSRRAAVSLAEGIRALLNP